MTRKTSSSGGTSVDAVALRRKVFFDAYQINGNNATQAAITAGASPTSAHTLGCRWLKEISGEVKAAAEKTSFDSGLTVERWAKEMACVAHVDPGDFYDADGALIPVHKLPEHVRRAVASVEHETRMEGKGPDRVAVTTQKVKLNDKNTALANIGRHLGVFDKDNAQRITAVQVNVTFLD